MAVENLKDRFFAGNKRIFRYTVVDADASGDPPLDLTPFSLRWAMSNTDAEDNHSTVAIVEKTTTGGGIVKTDAVNGICEVTVVAADTVALPPRLYYFELEAVDGASEPVVLATGVLTLLPNIVNS